MANYISFSLFGTSPIYNVGMLKNLQLARDIYPKWKVVVYTDHTALPDVVKELTKLGADVRDTPKEIQNSMFGRFLIADDPQMERFIIRDSDSRFSARERAAVDSWIESDMPFHVLSDHPNHWLPIGGGLWGAKRGAIKGSMKDMIVKSRLASEIYIRERSYSLDQIFLAKYILPQATGKIIRHDSCCRNIYPWAKPFPSGCVFGDWRFVGEVHGHDDAPNPIHWQQRVNFMTPA